jgi:hypothetical protein
MIRRYVLLPSVGSRDSRYIVAECVSGVDASDDGFAYQLAGPDAIVATEYDLLQDARGRIALAAWRARDDRWFEADSRLLAFGVPVNGVRSVRSPLSGPDLNASRERGKSLHARATVLLEQNQMLRSEMRTLRAEMHTQALETKRSRALHRKANNGQGVGTVIPFRRRQAG